jgi:hypothetical protein
LLANQQQTSETLESEKIGRVRALVTHRDQDKPLLTTCQFSTYEELDSENLGFSQSRAVSHLQLLGLAYAPPLS